MSWKKSLFTWALAVGAIVKISSRSSAAVSAVSLPESDSTIVNGTGDSVPELEIGSGVAEYLSDVGSESFKLQADLDEAIWRSLPFFAATFAFVAALVARAAHDLPVFELKWLSIVTHILLGFASLSMAWVLRWFAAVLRPREYEYPAKVAEIQAYARAEFEYYTASGLSGEEADKRTLNDLHLFMAQQHGNAASTNFVHNADRMKARSKVLLFLLAGFLLAFACEATIFVANRMGVSTVEGALSNEQPRTNQSRTLKGRTSDEAPNEDVKEARSPETAAGNGGRELLGTHLESADQDQTLNKPTSSSDRTPTPEKPKPPQAQVMMKRIELGRSKPNPERPKDKKS